MPWSALLGGILLVALATPALCAIEPDLSRPGAGGPATPVKVGIYLADFGGITEADQTYRADVVVQAEWQDPRLAGDWTGLRGADLDDVWHPRLLIVNQGAVFTYLPQRVSIDPSGLVRYRQRWVGRFTTRMDLREFPRDRQTFGIQVVSLGYPRSEVALLPDSATLPSGRAARLSQTEWNLGPAVVKTADYEPAPGSRSLAGLELVWEGRRYVGYYIVQVILPLIMIVLMGWTPVWVDPTVVTTRMSVVVTTMLTVIAYRFAFARLLPNLSYLTRFDYFTLGSTILVFLMLLVVTATAYLVGQNRRALVDRIDRTSRWLFPVLFAALCLIAGTA